MGIANDEWGGSSTPIVRYFLVPIFYLFLVPIFIVYPQRR